MPLHKYCVLNLFCCLQLGHEREAAICLMQKYIDQDLQNQPLLIKSAIALDHLKGYLYIESEKEAYVRQVHTHISRPSFWAANLHKIPINVDQCTTFSMQ